MSRRLKKADVVIIGIGASGGYASLALTRGGADVVALEAGPRWQPDDFPMDEIRNDVRSFTSHVKFAKELPTWRRTRKDVADQTGVVIGMMNGVGGTSLHYGMEQWRYLPWNFKERSETIKRYGRSAIPSDSTIADWPISYEDVEPYYDKVEYDMGTSGKAGNIKGKRVAGGNYFEGPRRREYPIPPLRRSGWTELTAAAAKKRGWHPFPGPAAIRSEAYHGLPGCQYCGFCTYNGCMVDAKGATDVGAIAEAERTKRLKILTHARVTKIEVDKHGRATGATFVRGGKTYFQPADVVVLSTYIYENTRLLLLSKSKAFPHGLSNNAGQVGKHYISHLYGGVNGVFPGMALNRFSGPGAQGGFARSSQHLDVRGGDGQAGGVDEGVDGSLGDEVAGQAVASARGRVVVLAGDRQGPEQRGRRARRRGVAGGWQPMVQRTWRDGHAAARPDLVPVLVLRRARGDRPAARRGQGRARDRA